MSKQEIYGDIESVPATTDYVVVPGRQLYVGNSLEQCAAQPYGLSPMSRLNVVAGVMVAEATGSMLCLSGNESAGFPQGARYMLMERYPAVDPLLEPHSPTTLASARNLAPLLTEFMRQNGALEVVIASDRPQGVRLAEMLEDNAVPVRGIAVAHRIAAVSLRSDERQLAAAYGRNWMSRHLEDAKQNMLRVLDPHGTRVETLARRVRPQARSAARM